MAVKVVGLSGSLAPRSTSLAALRVALVGARAAKTFGTGQRTTPEATTAEAVLQPASDAEARRSKE